MKNKIKIVCEYCKLYVESSKRKVEIVEKRNRNVSIQLRKCSIKKDYVKVEDKACDKFIMTEIFYCKKKNVRIPTRLCISRRERKIEGCQRCKQGKLIGGIYEQNNN